jgi:heme-degrading monooxygenase HmoA
MSTIVLFRIVPRKGVDSGAYERAFQQMVAEVSASEGFLGMEGYAAEDGTELAVARFRSVADVRSWRDHPLHVLTRERGRNEFFQSYEITIAEAGRTYAWDLETDDTSEPPPAYYTSQY